MRLPGDEAARAPRRAHARCRERAHRRSASIALLDCAYGALYLVGNRTNTLHLSLALSLDSLYLV